MKAVFLDFDGVIVDSIKECYEVSLLTYQGFKPLQERQDERYELFCSARGLVGPAGQYLFLHEAVSICMSIPGVNIAQAFTASKDKFSTEESERFEAMFFACRNFLKRNLMRWLEMHSLTDFGRQLARRDLPHHYVITTKDIDSVRILLAHFEIAIDIILGRDDFKHSGNKGALIQRVMEANDYDEAEFVDDNQTHLETVRDPRVRLVFADWGYGSLVGHDINKRGTT